MSRIVSSVFAACLTATLSVSSAHAQTLQCTDIARTLKEFSISTSSTSYLNSVFDNYCEASGSKRSSSAYVGIDVVVKAIPIQFTGATANAEEAMKSFCKNYASSSSLQERKFTYEERIASKALDTVSDCLRLQTQGVTITHDIVNRETAAFFLKSSVEQKISLTGVSLSSSVACVGLVNGKKQTFSDSTFVNVSKSQNFTCTRTPQAAASGNIKTFGEATIVVSTNFGNYNVLWPRDERLPEDMASAVARDLQAVRGSVSALTTASNNRFTQLDKEPKYGGAFQQAQPGFPTQNEFTNPFTKAFSCPAGFAQIQIGRMRAAEPEVGVNQFVCVKNQ